MSKKQNRFIVIIVLIILLIFAVLLLNNLEKSNNTYESNISIYRVESVVKSNIDAREMLKTDGNILVGYSKKELENGYYDLKYSIKEKSLAINVNKVWKEFNGKLYEEKYVSQIASSIIDIFGIYDNNAGGKIQEYIIEGYLICKGILDKELSDEVLKIGNVKFVRKISNNELILSIYKEGDK